MSSRKEEVNGEQQANAGDTAAEVPSGDGSGRPVVDVPESAAEAAEGASQRPETEAASNDVAALAQELETVREQLLRTAAEYQNYRRRTEAEKEGLVEYGKTVVIQQLLDIVDDFGRSLEAAGQLEQQEQEPGAAYTSLKQGVEMVHRKLLDAFKKLGVEPIEAVGQPFNEEEHEALMQQEAPEGTDAGVVLQEFQRGYRLGSRVLRHSKVVVSA